MKHILPLLAISATTGLMAQPTLTAADLTPIVGTSFTYYTTDYIAPGPATANFNFDLGGLVAQDTTTVQVMMPGSTPDAGSFPNATYVLAYTGDPTITTYSYMRLDPVSLQDHGSAYTGSVLYRSNSIVEAQLPCTMGTNWSDTFNGSNIPASGSGDIDGFLTGQCNGYGTLVLPSGTFTNVLRIETQETSTHINQTTGDTSTEISNTVSYMAAGVPIWLFQSVTATGMIGQYQFSAQASAMLDAATVGITKSTETGPGTLLFPNPANDAFAIAFNEPFNGSATVTLLDALGRKVSDLPPTSAVTNVTTMSFDVSSVPRGMYIVHVVDVQGRSSNMPLVLH